MTEELRMGAYYYGFAQTGARAVDKVLSAVACAGKAFHHTSEWNDDAKWDGHKGETPVDWIQNAADEAAAEIVRLRAALHRISLGSQNSGTTKEYLGREARAALGEERT